MSLRENLQNEWSIIHEFIPHAELCEVYKIENVIFEPGIQYEIKSEPVRLSEQEQHVLTQLLRDASRRDDEVNSQLAPNYLIRFKNKQQYVEVFLSTKDGSIRIAYQGRAIALRAEKTDVDYYQQFMLHLFNRPEIDRDVRKSRSPIAPEALRSNELSLEPESDDWIRSRSESEPECLTCCTDGIQRVQGRVTQPVIIRRVEPRYTQLKVASLRNPGAIITEAIIDQNGNVCCARMLRKLADSRWEEATLKAISEWKFEPAMMDGHPVCVYFTLSTIIHVR